MEDDWNSELEEAKHTLARLHEKFREKQLELRNIRLDIVEAQRELQELQGDDDNG
jgi:chromosome segregation ATPase